MEGTPLPWEASHPLSSRRTPSRTTRRYLIYCGVFGLDKVRFVLEEKFGKDPETFDERSDGETSLFAFSVTDDGRPLFDTFVLSTCAWATARTLNPGPGSADWLSGFESTASKLVSEFEEGYALRPDDTPGQEIKSKGFNFGRPIAYADLLHETKRIAGSLGIGCLCNGFEIRIKAGLIASSKKFSGDDQDFLNSFYVKDLGKVAAEVRNNNLGKGLATFLASSAEVDPAKRIDVRKSINKLFQQLSPELFPLGRWPSKGHHPLVFSQQFAVNSMIQDLIGSSGLFAVNGPPGTGKTTLLRDLIAAVIVERANRLSELARPEYAFIGEKRWKVGEFNRVISIWKEELRGFEIVVSSNNNGAVENVTLEIPGQEAIDPAWTSETDYFPELATRLIDQPAWAMIAARLGNKANRNTFMNRFWYGNKELDDPEEDVSAVGFLSLLKAYEQEPAYWESAVNRFKKAVSDEQLLREDREIIYRIYQEFFSLYQEFSSMEKRLSDLGQLKSEAKNQLISFQEAEKVADLKAKEAKIRRLEHRKFLPGFIEILFTFGKAFREWRIQDKRLESSIQKTEIFLEQTKGQTESQSLALGSLESDIHQVSRILEQKRKSLTDAQEKLYAAKSKLGPHFPIPNDWVKDEKARELSSPWADPEWNAARAKVFLEALQLHKAFVVANAGPMRKTLQGAMDVLSGAVPDNAPRDAVEAAWTALFFVIPVISTTFASFDRLFSHLGAESIGWLLIDEAGQAVPQSAVGGIWRSKRSVVMGDPLQLEPVVTIPMTVRESLRKYYQVEEIWLPGTTTSVQKLADRVSHLGTYVNSSDDPIWVGSPLRVHRRCDQPMFDISNKVAYDGLMIFGTPPRSSLDLPASCWVHVESNNSLGHWIPEEGHAVIELIEDLAAHGVKTEEIFVISPFRVVVRQLRQISSRFKGVRAGTIHTVQGKESDVVILVLGGDIRRPGAKQWASSRPNLLNVAASRAKRRLYVVGNRESWKQYKYFSTCAAILK